MTDTNQSWNDKANALKTQAAEKLEELKKGAGDLADTVKEKAGQAWDKLNSPETKAQLDHLKDQAVEKLEEAEEQLQQLSNKARDLWNKATHHGSAQPAGNAPATGNTAQPSEEHHDDPSKD